MKGPISSARLRLPRLFGDNMVLQRDSGIKVWGWAQTGAKVELVLLGKSYCATGAADGKWRIALPALTAGGPYNMEIQSGSDSIMVRNILIGDVWVCSGQSNMGLPLARVNDLYAKELSAPDHPAIRQFVVAEKYDFWEQWEDLDAGCWEFVNPENVLRFSAVGYFFARTLFEKYQIPIGLINASLGGAPVEAFLSEAKLKEFPTYFAMAEKLRDNAYLERIMHENQTAQNKWYTDIQLRDRGLADQEKPWYRPECDVAAWATMQVPAFWEDEGIMRGNGVVWFRKEINIPEALAGQPARLFLGRIIDGDTVYINGTRVGATGYQYPPRIYDIPAHLLVAGKNTIVVRIVNASGQGGFVKDKPYCLTLGGQSIDLKGEWRCQVGAGAPPLPEGMTVRWQPLGLFNGMVAPLTNYSIKGVIWYQGESNIPRVRDYRRLFAALIADWREKWGQGDFPFLYVQLPNYLPANDQPSESDWAELRDAQLRTLAVPNTGMAVTIDLGEWNDLHPLNKKDVGYRLALVAQKVAYGDAKVVASGPIFQSLRIADGKVVVTFSNTGGGLMVKGGGALKGFAIAGADHKYVWAQAGIEANRVVAWSEAVPRPVALRYAWADNPAAANLYNMEGLPASPFTTEE